MKKLIFLLPLLGLAACGDIADRVSSDVQDRVQNHIDEKTNQVLDKVDNSLDEYLGADPAENETANQIEAQPEDEQVLEDENEEY